MNDDLRKSLSLANEIENPDTFSKALAVSDSTGAPLDLVQKHGPEIEKSRVMSDRELDLLVNQAVVPQDWAKDPKNMALVADDFSQFGKIKRYMSLAPEQILAGVDEVELYNLRTKEMFGTLTPEETVRATALNTMLDRTPDYSGNLTKTAIMGTARTLPQLWEQAKGAAAGGAVGGIGALAIGNLSPLIALPEELVTVPTGVVAGARTGMIYNNFAQQAGAIRNDLLKVKNERGQKLDNDVVNGAAFLAGAANAGLDILPFEALLKGVPGADKIEKLLTRDGMRQAMKLPGVQQVLKKVGKRVAAAGIAEGGVEGVQQFIQIGATEIAKEASSGDFEPVEFSDAAGQIGGAAVGGAVIGTTLGAGIASVGLPYELRNVGRFTPEEIKQHIQGINESVKQDVLFQRSPERFRSLISEMAGGEKLYVNAEALNNLVVGLPDDARADVFAAIPDLAVELEAAAVTGADISVSKADYAAVLTQIPQVETLADFIKLDPADMTVSEQKEFTEILRQNPELAQQDNAAPNSPEMEQAIERVVKKALMKSGRGQEESRSVAPLFAKTYARFARALGLDAKGLLVDTPLQFESVDSTGQAIKQGSNVGVLLDNLVKQRAGGKVRLDAQTKTAVDDLYTRLETIGLTPEDAKAMPQEDLINALYPQGGEQASLSQIEKVPLPSGLETNVFVNPTADQARALMQKSAAGIARSVKDAEGNLYMWDAYDLTHGDLMKHYGIPDSQFNTTETHQSAERAAAVADSASRSRTGKLNQSAIKTDTPEFKAWFGDSKVVDAEGKPLVVYHGTTADFEAFDTSKGSSEADFGKGIYFTNEEGDVAVNYAGEGPDLTNKIQRVAEQIASETDREYDDPDVVAEAKAKYVQNGGVTIPVYLSIKDPVIVGGDSETIFTYEQGYDEDTEEFGEPTGILMEFIESMREIEGDFSDADTGDAISALIEEAQNNGEGLTASDVVVIIKEKMPYVTDGETGDMAVGEFIRAAFEKTGFDGIIDNSVDEKFGTQKKSLGKAMEGMNPDTVHYIAFRPEQVKSIFNTGAFDPNNPNILQQRERGSIRMTKDAESALQRTVISFTERADFSTAVHEFSHWAVATHRQFVNLARNGDQNNPEVRRIIDDWEALKKQVGADSDTFTVDQEEKIASLFEAYMRDGNAPSDSLRRVFTRFRDWLTRIYKDVRALNVELNPEVRGIFDRWLASEDEIAVVQEKNSSLATIAESLGLGNIVGKVADYVNSAVMVAEERVYRQLSAEKRRLETKSYKDEFASVRKTVAADVAKRPAYSLVNFLRESGQRIYIDPRAQSLADAPGVDFAPENAAPVSIETLEAYHDETLSAEARREAVVSLLLRPAPKKPLGITSFLVKRGGLKDEGGELTRILDKKGRRVGLINNKSGMTLDDARAAAVEAKYLDGAYTEGQDQSVIDDLLDAIRAENMGGNVFSENDYDAALEYDSYQQAQREADELGVDIEYERLLRRKYGVHADLFTDDASAPNAVRADEIAEMYGYGSGKEMISVLRRLPDFDWAVDADTRAALLKKYPDMIKDGSIKVKAVDAILNDKVMIALDVMIKELGKRTGQNRVSMKQFARVMAQQHLARTKVGDASYAFRYEVARERELRSALQKSRAGKPEESMLHLQRAMVNQAIYKSLQEFKEVKEKAGELFKRVSEKDKNLAPSTDIDFLGVARHLLSRFGLGGERFNYNAWKNDIAARDPQLLSDMNALVALEDMDDKPAKELTISEFMQVYDSVKNIFWAAKNLKQFEIGEKKISVETAVAELIATMDTMAKAPEIEGTQVRGKAKIHATLMGYKAVARRVESWVRSMDGGDSGAFRTYIWNPISGAANAYRAARADWMMGLNDIFQKHRDHLLDGNKVSVPELGKVFADRREFIGFLLHTGNESNLEKLIVGYGREVSDWQAARAAMVADGRLTKADMDLVQELWDYAEQLKGLSQRAHKQLYGYRFEEIEASPSTFEFGAYRGGYWPAIVDSEQIDTNDAEKFAEEIKLYSLASTNKGFTKARNAAFKKPLSTDLRLATSHIDTVLRFSYLEAPVRQVARVMNRQEFKDSLKSVDAEAYRTMLLPWLQRSALQQATTPSRSAAFRKFDTPARWLRSSASAQTMMLNVANALQNFTSLPIVMYRVGPRNFAKGMALYLKNPSQAVKQVRSLSMMMQTRQNVLDVDVSIELRDIIERTGPYTKVKSLAAKHGYVLQRLTQGSIDTIAWLSAYSEKMGDGATEVDAVSYADSVVRETQSSSSPEDVSAIESGSDLAKLFLMFYTYFNTIGNFAGTELRTMVRKSGFLASSPKMFYMYMMVVGIPALLGDTLVKAMRDDLPDDDDDDGEVLDDWLSYIAGTQLRYVAATVPFAGQAFNSLMGMAMTKQQYDDRITASPVFGLIEGVGRFAVKMAEGGYDDNSRMVRDAFTNIGFVTGLPLGQLGKPAAFIADVQEGDARPKNVSEFTRGVLGGPAPTR